MGTIEIRTEAGAAPASADGPHDPEQTIAIAAGVAEALRLLNYATMAGRDGLQVPGDLYSVCGELEAGNGRLPQALEQMDRWLTGELADGAVRENPDHGPYGGDTTAAAAAFSAAMSAAADHAKALTNALDIARSAVRGLESTRDARSDT